MWWEWNVDVCIENMKIFVANDELLILSSINFFLMIAYLYHVICIKSNSDSVI